MIGRKFVCLVPTDRSMARLKRLSERLGFDTSKGYNGQPIDSFPYHMTLLYSKEEDLDYPDVEVPLGQILRVSGSHISRLGNAIVLKTTITPKLIQIRNNVIKNLGATHTHDEFIPHVSLTYIDKEDFEDPTPLWYKPIFFDKLRIETSD